MRIHADRAGCSRAQSVPPLWSQSTGEVANIVERALIEAYHTIYLVFCHLQEQKLADWLKKTSTLLFIPSIMMLHTHLKKKIYFCSMPLTLLFLCACQTHLGIYRSVEKWGERSKSTTQETWQPMMGAVVKAHDSVE